jgi:predicted flap endonuclease-1-like 5' DNA nuclease
MKKLARFFGLVAGLGAVAYVLRDRLISLAPPREPERPRFQQMARPTPLPSSTPAGDDLTEINGIGPVFAERLIAEGIMSFADLAGQDAAKLAEKIDVAETRIAPWIEEAGTK